MPKSERRRRRRRRRRSAEKTVLAAKCQDVVKIKDRLDLSEHGIFRLKDRTNDARCVERDVK